MFRKGRVSYSKVRAMTRVATRKNERYLLMIARHGTAHHVERVVRNYRKVKRSEALTQENTRHAQRELSWYVDDEGYWVLRGRFTAEQGALIQNALEQAMEEDFQEQKNVAAETSRRHRIHQPGRCGDSDGPGDAFPREFPGVVQYSRPIRHSHHAHNLSQPVAGRENG
jgi:hypothetical protein